MDATSSEMVDFTVIPVETIAVCNYIFHIVGHAIKSNGSDVADHEIDTLLDWGLTMIRDISSWPLIVAEHSHTCKTAEGLRRAALAWLGRSPLFKESRDELLQYLSSPFEFCASDLVLTNLGNLKFREDVLLKQSAREHYRHVNNQFGFMLESEENRKRYRQYLTLLMWMRDDPLPRMFVPCFKGTYQETTKNTDLGEDLHELENLSIDGNASTVAMHTSSTTCATSPALTERPDNSTTDKTTDSKPIVPPTLKYIAFIETDTDKAIFNLDISDVNEKKRRVMMKVKEACTEMVSKGYGDKVKLQDIMDLVVKMAKK